MQNIQKANAKLDLVEKFLDYADCADVSYALLNYQVKSGEKKCL